MLEAPNHQGAKECSTGEVRAIPRLLDFENGFHYREFSMSRTLADLRPAESGWIDRVAGNDGLSQRLSELGFTSGQAVRIVRFAPLGDPMQVHIRGFDLAVRRAEAQRVLLK
jgi:ferrous iron transport protein A